MSILPQKKVFSVVAFCLFVFVSHENEVVEPCPFTFTNQYFTCNKNPDILEYQEVMQMHLNFLHAWSGCIHCRLGKGAMAIPSIYLSIYLSIYICVCVCAFCLYLYVLKYAVALSCLNTSHHETRLWLQKVVWLCEHAGLAQPFFP